MNIIVKPGWILERLARELQSRLPDISVNHGKGSRWVNPRAAVQYYLPARDINKYPCDGRALGFYTHGETGFDLISRFDGVSAMNQQMAARLLAAGADDVQVIRPGIDPTGHRVTFGVIGRVYNNGRKGEALVAEAVRAGFSVVACGPERRVAAMTKGQWPCATPYTLDDRAAFYRAIDYLLVTSLEEGGPMPVLEAISYGVPVITPSGVGWCDEFPAIRYERGSWESLRAVLTGLTEPPTWDAWAEGHRQWFARVAEAIAA